MLYDFIEIYDLEAGEKNCERIIEFFESVYDEKSSKDLALHILIRIVKRFVRRKLLTSAQTIPLTIQFIIL